MDERNIKRLLVIVGVSLIAIFVFKSLMSKTIVKMNRAAIEKKLAAPAPADTPVDGSAIVTEAPATSATAELPILESSAVSAVSEGH